MAYDFEAEYAENLKEPSTERLEEEIVWVNESWVAEHLKELATSLIKKEVASRDTLSVSTHEDDSND